MSLILDALKKLDRDKSSRRTRTSNIAVEILRPDRPGRGRRIRVSLAVIFVTAIAAAAITYGMIGRFGAPSKSAPPPRGNPPIPNQETAPSASSREPVREAREGISEADTKAQSPAAGGADRRVESGTERSVTSTASRKSPAVSSPPTSAAPVAVKPPSQEAVPSHSREPEREARSESSQGPPKIQSPGASGTDGKDSASIQGGEKPSEKVIRDETNVAPGTPKRTVEPPPKEPTPPPSLKLSGILWHEEPSERRAMINGMILSEGAVIEGAKVVEIYPTRVRLSHNGQYFEISINILDR